MKGLAALQQAMRDALHTGDRAALLARLVGTPTRSPAEQLAVYENMYFARQIEALNQDFPCVAARLGPELFPRVAVTHVKRCPSQHPSLAFLGRGFGATLAGLGLVAESDIARLEEARNEAFWAPDRAAIPAADLGALGDDLGEAVLLFHPSLRCLAIPRAARAAVEGAALEASGAEVQQVAVWRQGHAVVHEVIVPLAAGALGAALGGASVAEVFELFVGEEDPESAALGALLAWVARGWVVGVRGTAGG